MLKKLSKIKKELCLNLFFFLLICVICTKTWGLEEENNFFFEYSLNDHQFNGYNDLECDDNYYGSDEMKDELIGVNYVFLTAPHTNVKVLI